MFSSRILAAVRVLLNVGEHGSVFVFNEQFIAKPPRQPRKTSFAWHRDADSIPWYGGCRRNSPHTA
jgi:hypothetical protein